MLIFLQAAVLMSVINLITRNKGYLILLYFCLLSSIFSYGQTKTVNQEHVLWQITNKDGKIKGYLVGSIHSVDSTFFPLDKIYTETLKKSSPIVFEIKDWSKAMNNLVSLIHLGIYKNGESLKDKLTPKLYGKVKYKFEKFGLPNPEKFKPWLATLTLLSYDSSNHGQLKEGIDDYFYKLAKNNHKRIIGLETSEEQVQVFSDRSEKAQIALLKYVLKDQNKGSYSLEKYWRAGNVKRLQKIIRTGKINNIAKSSFELKRYLVVKRNERWKKKIIKIISEGNIPLIVVGIGHLIGKHNLINLLRNDGFIIKQM